MAVRPIVCQLKELKKMMTIPLRVGTITGPIYTSIGPNSLVFDIITDLCRQLDIPDDYAPAFVLLKRTAKASVECMEALSQPYYSVLHGNPSIFLRIAIFPTPEVVKYLNKKFRLILLEQVQRAIITHIWRVNNEYSLLFSAFYYIITTGTIPNIKEKHFYSKYVQASAGRFINSDILVRYNDKSLEKMFKHMFSSIIEQGLAPTPDEAIQHYFNIVGTSLKQYGYACFHGSVRKFDRMAPESDTILLLNHRGILFLNADLSENTGYTFDALIKVVPGDSQINLTVLVHNEPKEMILEVDRVSEIVSFITYFSTAQVPSPYVVDLPI